MVECPWRGARSGWREAEASLGKGAARRIIHPNEMVIDILRGAAIRYGRKAIRAFIKSGTILASGKVDQGAASAKIFHQRNLARHVAAGEHPVDAVGERGAAAHVAGGLPNISMIDLDGPDLMRESYTAEGPEFSGPVIRLNETPGIGITHINSPYYTQLKEIDV